MIRWKTVKISSLNDASSIISRISKSILNKSYLRDIATPSPQKKSKSKIGVYPDNDILYKLSFNINVSQKINFKIAAQQKTNSVEKKNNSMPRY